MSYDTTGTSESQEDSDDVRVRRSKREAGYRTSFDLYLDRRAEALNAREELLVLLEESRLVKESATTARLDAIEGREEALRKEEAAIAAHKEALCFLEATLYLHMAELVRAEQDLSGLMAKVGEKLEALKSDSDDDAGFVPVPLFGFEDDDDLLDETPDVDLLDEVPDDVGFM